MNFKLKTSSLFIRVITLEVQLKSLNLRFDFASNLEPLDRPRTWPYHSKLLVTILILNYQNRRNLTALLVEQKLVMGEGRQWKIRDLVIYYACLRPRAYDSTLRLHPCVISSAVAAKGIYKKALFA